MGLINKKGNEIVKSVRKNNKVGNTTSELVKDFEKYWNEFYFMEEHFPIKSIEEVLLKQKQEEIYGKREVTPRGLPKFSPSSADKCPLELFNGLMRIPEDEITMYPYNRRWTRNASFVHEAIQRDLLYFEKLVEGNPFSVCKASEVVPKFKGTNKENLPAWERNILSHKVFLHNGEKFCISGMMDGNLWYKGEHIGFEIKTKSTTIASVGDFKLKSPMESHVKQQVAYSILFFGEPYEERTDRFLIYYESLAKDSWTKGEEAKKDYKVFEVNVTLEDRLALLDKFAMVTKAYREKVNPCGDCTKCFFCPYHNQCPFYNQCKGGCK